MQLRKLLIIGMIILVSSSFQEAWAQSKIGVRAGYHLSGIRAVDEFGDSYSSGLLPRFHIGVTINLPMHEDLFLQPGIMYSGKGFKEKGGWLTSPGNEFRATVSYVEVPLNLIIKPRLANGKLMLGAGPYLAYGTGGQWKADQDQVTIGDIVIDPNGAIIFRNDQTDGEFGHYLYGKPWDYGINALVGYGLSEKLSIQLQAQFGLANLQPKVDGTKREGSIKNVLYGISLGYQL